MRSIEYRALQALLWLCAVSHLTIGGGIMLSSSFQRALAPLYGAEVHWTTQLTYLLRVLGAFMFVIGFLVTIAALAPLRHRTIIYGLCGVLVLRVLQRILFFQEVKEGFSITLGWYFAMGGFFLLLAISILVLLQIASKTAAPAPTSQLPSV